MASKIIFSTQIHLSQKLFAFPATFPPTKRKKNHILLTLQMIQTLLKNLMLNFSPVETFIVHARHQFRKIFKLIHKRNILKFSEAPHKYIFFFSFSLHFCVLCTVLTFTCYFCKRNCTTTGNNETSVPNSNSQLTVHPRSNTPECPSKNNRNKS